MKTEYNGIEITYDETKNVWRFELRGRTRSAESLAKAKEAIDKEPADKRKQEFPRFDAYLCAYGDNFSVVTVTGIAESRGWSTEHEFWVKNANGDRSKQRFKSLFPVNDTNTAIVEEAKRISEEVAKLEERRRNVMSKLVSATVPKELE